MPVPSGSLLDAAHTPCGLAALDEAGHLLEVNAELERMLGRPPGSLAGQHVDVLFRPASRLLFHTHVLPTLKVLGHLGEVDLPLKQADGQELDTLMSATRDPAHEPVVVRCAFFRLRERRRLENELFNVKRAAEQVPGLIFQLRRSPDGQTHFAYANDALRELYGATPQQARQSAEPVWQRLHPEDAARVQAEMEDSAARLRPWRSEFRVCLPASAAPDTAADGGPPPEQWRELLAMPQRERNGWVVWNGFSSDITERRGLEAARLERDAAERATQAKSDFLAHMSHELRTPLNGILGFARLLQMQAGARLTDKDKRYLTHIETTGGQLLNLVNELLDISAIEAGRLEIRQAEVALHETAQDVLRLLEPLAATRGIALSLQGSGRAQADPQRLRQCLTNLVSNAIKYNRDGGRVELSITDHADGMRLAIRDQGQGLDAQQQAQLFQPFNRLGADHSKVEGTGLGLVITRNLIERMGGRLELDSAPGQGSCFSIVLPAALASSPPAA